MSDSPLNRTLYGLLVRRFGEGRVNVTSPGVGISWTLRCPANGPIHSIPERKVLVSGEEYEVACPFCRDWKKRLSINHRWGVWDPETRSRNLWLAHCYNEECLADPTLQQQLYVMVYGRHADRKDVTVLPGKAQDTLELRPAEPPGQMIRLDELARRHPRHHALVYLESRQFDPVALGQMYGVSYCPQSRYGHATDRIIIPVRERGILYGWQARYIGDDFGGRSLKDADVPKYWTMPGMPKRVLGYNMDQAVRHQTVAIVEGPADVWGFGPQAFAIFGKTLHPRMIQKLRAWLNLYWGDEAAVVVLLDPDQDAKAKLGGRPHHIAKVAAALRDGLGRALGDRVLPVYLPAGTDPGGLDRDFQRRAVREAAAKQGVPVMFGKAGRKPALSANQLIFETESKHVG